MKKLIVAYRENELFKALVPAILALLPADVIIEKFVYAAGTAVKQIQKELVERLKEMSEEFAFLHDETCNVIYDKAISEETRKKITRIGLDRFFMWEVRRLFDDEKIQSFASTLKQIAMLVHEFPSVVCIVEDHLIDHVGPSIRKELNVREVEVNGYKRADSFELCRALKNVFKGIFPEAEAKSVSKADEAFGQYGNNPNAVLVIDRHCPEVKHYSVWDIAEWSRAAKLLMLPLENAAHHLSLAGKLGNLFEQPTALYPKLFKEFLKK